MPTSNLNIVVLEKRMLSAKEAATYVNLSLNDFKIICPVHPLKYSSRRKVIRPLWDKKELDLWIEDQKRGFSTSIDELLNRLD